MFLKIIEILLILLGIAIGIKLCKKEKSHIAMSPSVKTNESTNVN